MASLIVKITGDASGFKGVTDNVGRALDSVSTRAARVSETIGSFGSSLSIGLTLPAVAAGAAAVRAAADFEKLNKGLASVMGSTQAGAAEFRKLQDAAKLPGLGLEQAVAGSIRLQVLGNSADKSRKVMAELGNAIALVGGSKDDFAEVTRQLGQMLSVGKVTKENLDPITERIPQIAKLMLDTFGPQSLGDPAKFFQKAGISSSQFVDIIVAKLGEGARAGDTFSNKIGNLQEAVKIAAASVGEKLIPAIEKLIPKMESLASGVAGAVSGFLKLPNEVQNTAIALGAVALAAGPAIKAIQGVITAITTMQTVAGIASAGMVGLFGGVVIAGIVQTMSAIDRLNERYRDLAKARTLFESGKADPASGLTESGRDLGKFKIDLKGISDELNLFGKKHDEVKPKVAALGVEVAKTSNIIKVSSVAGLIYVESLERVKTAVGKVKDVMYEWSVAGTAVGKTIDTHASILDASTLAAQEYSNRLRDIRRELENMPAPKVQDITVNQRRGTVLETQDILGASSTISQSQRVAQAEADLERIKQLNAEGKATGNDVIAAQQNLKKIMEENGRVATTSGKAQSKATQQVSLIVNDLARGITDVIFKGGKLGDMFKSVASQAAQSITRLLIEGALTKLASKLLEVGGIMGKVFGGGTGAVMSATSGGAASAVGSAAGGIGSAASGVAGSAVSSSITGMVSAVTGVVSAVSGVISNFQFMAMNKTLDLIEHEVRYSQIHLLNTLNKANEFWPYMKNCWESLIRMEQRGMGLGGGGVQVNMAGAYLLTDSALDDFIERIARQLKTQGI
jgi:tape measure domain-containing protein